MRQHPGSNNCVPASARSSSLSDDSRARGRQRDLLGPPQGRRRRFHFRSIRFGAAAIAASVSGATRSGRLGGAAAAGRRRHRGDDGARALVANAADGCGRRPRAARYGVIANRRHWKDQRFRGRVPPLYPIDSRARGRQRDLPNWGENGRRRRFLLAAPFGSGPRRSLRRSAERPARAAWAALRLLADVAIGATMELGRSWRTPLMGAAAGRAPRGTGSSPTGGIERPAV